MKLNDWLCKTFDGQPNKELKKYVIVDDVLFYIWNKTKWYLFGIIMGFIIFILGGAILGSTLKLEVQKPETLTSTITWLINAWVPMLFVIGLAVVVLVIFFIIIYIAIKITEIKIAECPLKNQEK